MTPEGKVKKSIAEYLKNLGVFFWYNSSVGVWDAKRGYRRKNFSPYAINGVSDILGILPCGRFIAIEVKAPGVKRGTPNQDEFIRKINRNGGLAFYANSVAECEKKITNELMISLGSEDSMEPMPPNHKLN